MELHAFRPTTRRRTLSGLVLRRLESCLGVFGFFLFTLLGPTIARADRPDLHLSALPAYGPNYWPGAWTPVRIDLQNDSNSPIDGSIWLPVTAEIGPATVVIPAFVPAHAHYRTLAYGYFPAVSPPAQARQTSPVISTPEWRNSSSGERLTQLEVIASPVGAESSLALHGIVLVVTGTEDAAPPRPPPESIAEQMASSSAAAGASYDEAAFRTSIGATLPVPTAIWHSSTRDLPRSSAGYESVQVILWTAQDPDDLDTAQRQALLDYVRAGGRLLVAAPVPGEGHELPAISHSWLAPYLPVMLIGARMATSLDDVTAGAFSPGMSSVPLREPVMVTEAVSAGEGVRVLLGGNEYVYAATAPLGLGDIVFTSFPVNAPDLSAEKMQQFWHRALDLDKGPVQWEATQLKGETKSVLQAMVGLTVPYWRTAAAIVCAYGLLALAAQLLWRGPRRPAAFLAMAVLSFIFAATLLGARSLRSTARPLTLAGLTTIDLGGEGIRLGGVQQESACLLGDAQHLALSSPRGDAVLRPADENTENPPRIAQQPFGAIQPLVSGDRVDEIWQASAPAPQGLGASAKATFGPDGLNLSIDNATAGTIASPLLMWGSSCYRLRSIAPGRAQATVTASQRNDLGDDADLDAAYRNSPGVVSDLDRQRARLLRAASLPAGEAVSSGNPDRGRGPILAGWLDDSAGNASILQPSQHAEVRRELMLLRFPVRLQPSPIGSLVHIDGGFLQMIQGQQQALPFGRVAGVSVTSSAGGDWLVGFVTPPGIGNLAIRHATLRTSISIPQRSMTLRLGQVSAALPRADVAGPVLARWTNAFGRQEDVSFDVSSADATADGRIWLLVSVDDPSTRGATPALWSIHDLALSIDAQVTAGPAQEDR